MIELLIKEIKIIDKKKNKDISRLSMKKNKWMKLKKLHEAREEIPKGKALNSNNRFNILSDYNCKDRSKDMQLNTQKKL